MDTSKWEVQVYINKAVGYSTIHNGMTKREAEAKVKVYEKYFTKKYRINRQSAL